MPHITLQVSAGGPLIDVDIGVSQARREALITANEPIPPPIRIRALIDTGASGTCIDPSILSQLGVPPTGSIGMRTPSTGDQVHNANQFDVSLALLSPKATLSFPTVAVIESQLAVQGIQALIGRDILLNCLFVYDGQSAIFALAF